MSKTRMSAVIDHSTMGINIGTEYGVSKATHNRLRKALKAAVRDGIRYNVKFKLISGHSLVGNAIYSMTFINRNNTETSFLYEFKQQNDKCFINVSGNPTTLAGGANDIPILIKGFEYGEFNAATITFKYLNRIMYAVFDTLLAEHGFKWEGVDKRRLVEGDINIQSYQIAWYSGDLGKYRDRLLRMLRVTYGGLDATKNKVQGAVSSIGLQTRIWDNHDGNLTIEARSGKNRYFSCTMYAKDDDPAYDKENEDRVCKLIRWDCTLNQTFLNANKIRKISELEEKYIEICDEHGYDIGFIRYISERVWDRLKLSYFIGLDIDNYDIRFETIKTVEGKYIRLLADHWLNYGESFSTDAEVATFLQAPPSRISEAKKELFEKTGVDFDIPRATHEAVLLNRALATMTIEERGEFLCNNGKSNSAPRFDELTRRDMATIKKYRGAVTNSEGLIKIRKFKPLKVTPDKFWIYRMGD